MVFHSLWPPGLQHARPPCLSPTLRAFSNSSSSSWWCHLIFCRPLLLLPSIFPSIRVFSHESVLRIRWPKCWSFASASVLAINIQHWVPLGWTGWISLQSKGLSRVFSNTTVQKHLFFGAQLSLWSNSHIHNITTENIALTIRNFVSKDGVVLALIWKITDYSSSKLQELTNGFRSN